MTTTERLEAGAHELPRWRTDDLYAGLNDPQLSADLKALGGEVRALEAIFDALGVRKGGNVATPEALEQVLGAMNTLVLHLVPVRGYLQAFVTTDSRNAAAEQMMGELTTLALPLGPLRSRLTAWLGEADVDALLAASEVARAHEHLLRRSTVYAQHQMTPQEEDLAARLRPSGAGGWAKLHGNVSSQLSGEYRGQRLPVTALRALATDPDEAVRRDAFEAELNVWQDCEVVLTAAMNGVKGEEGTLAVRRGFPDAVAPSLLTHGIDRETLEAMQSAVVRSLPDFRRYFAAKARALGKDKMDWWDLFAPLGRSETEWTYEAGTRFVERQFRGYSQKLGDYAARAFREGWIDAGPREGKRGGAFCMGWRGDESRILMNHDPSLDSVSTLAHELGHGYHNLLKAPKTALQRETPMTLAETASIFCETIIQNAALEGATGEERLYVLETQLLGHAQVVVDIHSRFLFERAVFQKRAERDLTGQELNNLMTWAQRETYGDALNTTHPYMWAVKPHYYSLGFYNYPYTFGLLFGLGLYAQYRQAKAEGREADFQARYDDLLSSTGLAGARTLAARFGIDLHAPEFWEESLDLIRGQIREYEKIIG
ncbi:M3 family oligoendopeptidase [Deinococcus hopiensis]|uniref:Oligoendopeptidase, pepF/M3 family n=1 Tax=Deinococcus hopiensis KR-140 TaxID=695939 RepID=A0A1W1VKQ7_9DEIO|nr:M3 family oligoendopeptidase [Deinococcus hopiensis]SMB93932.1 oligoendopeptidase, pepF/M3 family [Deinococcus hopiensis KR-140]